MIPLSKTFFLNVLLPWACRKKEYKKYKVTDDKKRKMVHSKHKNQFL